MRRVLITAKMVAEPTLFLSSDMQVQVRACTLASGREVFCVKDFIRQTANRALAPGEAMLYWLSALGNLMHTEEEIMNNIPILFAGPYEKPAICISAQGLLLVFHDLDRRFGLANDKYKSEVQDALLDIVAKGSAAGHVRMHDDGEIDELLAEKGLEPLTAPPPTSKYIFGRAPPSDEPPAQPPRQAGCKRKRGDGFSVKALLAEGRMITDVPPTRLDQLCKAVISEFRARYPDRDVCRRHGQVLFRLCDRPAVAEILHAEHLKLKLRLIDGEPLQLGAVSV